MLQEGKKMKDKLFWLILVLLFILVVLLCIFLFNHPGYIAKPVYLERVAPIASLFLSPLRGDYKWVGVCPTL
jgi:hypothetical protein